MRIVIVAVAVLWGIAAVLVFARTREKTLDAKLTAAYILLWPLLVVVLVLNEPVPMWVAVPAMFGFIPWLMAGPHLWRVLHNTEEYHPDEVMGIPKGYWTWGGLGAVLLGILFS